MKTSDLVKAGIGLGTGSETLKVIDNPIVAVATGAVLGAVVTKVASELMDETGLSDLLDDIF